MSFVHLHVHSDASPDGLGTIESLVKYTKSLGFTSLALTDHGTLANVVRFLKACDHEQIKPILGVEGYVHLDNRRTHITLNATGSKGWANLVALQNQAHAQSDNRRAAFTVDQLIKYNEGLICFTGCPESPLQKLSEQESLQLGVRLKGAFGNRLFAEIMHTMDDTKNIERALKLSTDLRIPLVATNDAHFQTADLAPIHKLLTRMKSAYDYESKELYLKTEQEMLDRATVLGYGQQFIDGMNNAAKIARSIITPDLRRKETLPTIENAQQKLWDLLGRNNPIIASNSELYYNEEYVDRVAFEMGVIEQRNAAAYFLILYDIVHNGIAQQDCNVIARGSGCGSLVLYLLGLTQIDPIIYGLSFERFLNPLRQGLPDVDLDMNDLARQMAIEYATKKYGGLPIANYGHYSQKSLTHALSRVLSIPKQFDTDIADNGMNSEYWPYVAQHWPDFPKAIKAMDGQIATVGTHAAGFVFETPDVLLPIERNKKGDQLQVALPQADTSEKSAEYVGAVKVDFLGSDALDLLLRLAKLTGIKAPLYHETNEDDRKLIYDLFIDKRTKGIHQFTGSNGITSLTANVLNSSGFNDFLFDYLVLCNAAYRPSAMDKVSKLPDYVSDPVSNPGIIADILAPTFGLIIFQEQMMNVYARVVNGGLAEADIARRIIVKNEFNNPKWQSDFAKMKSEFADGCKRNGIDGETGKRLWGDIVQSTGYGFNQSHAVAYTMLAWQMAWYKSKYPVQFYTEVCNSDQENVTEYLWEAAISGIEVKPPHVNVSSHRYETDGKAIYMPLRVKFLGENGATAIVEERKANGEYKSFASFRSRLPKRTITERNIKSLLDIGAFSGIIDPVLENQLEGTDKERQQKHLGVMLPTPDMIQQINYYLNKGYVCGVITRTDEKVNDKGQTFRRYWLTPNNQFVRNPAENKQYELGQLIVVKVGGRYHNLAQRIKEL